VTAAYRANEPAVAELAMDAVSANELKRIIGALSKRWQSKFDDGAEELGRYFAKSASRRTDAQLQAILKKAGYTVDFTLTAAQRDIIAATAAETTALIKSIPAKYLADVEGHVMRSVQTGMDVGGLRKKLQDTYKVTRKRASLISRDQNSKATSALNKARQLDLNVEEAMWMHSSAGKVPRPTHKANDGNRYEVAKGWYDKDANGPGKGAWVQPGELINCRCTSRSIFPGFI
jgi:uncharacterized protein with gpF-like domain